MRSMLVRVWALGVFVLPLTTWAGDLCLDAAQPNVPTLAAPIIIGRGFTVPKKNKCKPFIGVVATSVPAQPSAVTGAACTSFDGRNVTFTLVATLEPVFAGGAFRPGPLVHYSVSMTPQGANAGSGELAAYLPTGVTSTGPFVAFECRNAFPDNL
jgi:hypothetical protein